MYQKENGQAANHGYCYSKVTKKGCDWLLGGFLSGTEIEGRGGVALKNPPCMIKVTIVSGRESSSHGDLLRYQSHVMADQVQVVDQYQYQHHQYDQYQYHQYQLWPIKSR